MKDSKLSSKLLAPEMRPTVLFDASNTGSGKTSDVFRLAKTLSPKAFRVVFLVKSLKIYDLKRLKKFKFLLLIGRNGSIDANGQLIGNCIYGDCLNHLVQQNQTVRIICNKNCPMYSTIFELMCLFKKTRAEAKSKHIITTPQSYEPQKNDIVFIDESINSLPLFITHTIKLSDINAVIKRLNSCDLNSLIKNQKYRKLIATFIQFLNEVSNKINDLDKMPPPENKLSVTETNDFFDISEYFFQLTPKEEQHLFITIMRIYRATVKETIVQSKTKPSVDIEYNFLSVLLKYIFTKVGYGATLSNKTLIITEINPHWENYIELFQDGFLKQIILLDSTPNSLLLEYFKAKNVLYEIKDFSINKNRPEIIQFIEHSYSKTYTKSFKAIIQAIYKIIQETKGKVGIITHKSFLKEFEEFKDICVMGYWGNHNRATNEFEDCSTLIVIGKFIPPEDAIERELEALKKYIPELEFETKPKLLRHPHSNLGIYRLRHNDLMQAYFYRELHQALGRIGRGKNNKKDDLKVYLFTNEPLNINADKHLKISEFVDSNLLVTDKKQQQLNRDKTDRENRLSLAIKALEANHEKITITKIQNLAGVKFAHAQEYFNRIRPP